MRKTKTPLAISFFNKRVKTYLGLKYFVLASVVFISVSACKKTNTQATTGSSSNTSSIIYKTYAVDSVNFTADSILYDINNDNVNDIKVTMQHSFSANGATCSGNISGIKNNIVFCYIKTLPSWTMVAINDDINSTNSFNWNPTCPYSGSSPYFAGSNSWAQGVFTDYFGFEITLNSMNYYGWFHFKYQAISETAMKLVPGASIKVGQKM